MYKAYKQSASTINLIKKSNIDLYVAHEALLLDYEESLVRENEKKTFLSSTHLPWIGDRTRNFESAHIEFLRGVANPIGVKCGPTTDLEDLVKIIRILNPENENGKIMLMIRMGNGNVEKFLPGIINAIEINKLNVLWVSDPMHGNGKKLSDGTKTRYYDDILGEIKSFFNVCKDCGVCIGGIHLEMTGLDVTECIGGFCDETNIKDRYETLCDPRLNREQSLSLAKELEDII
jgi:3-deoxy-7-phosphoheptulonate synthase